MIRVRKNYDFVDEGSRIEDCRSMRADGVLFVYECEATDVDGVNMNAFYDVLYHYLNPT